MAILLIHQVLVYYAIPLAKHVLELSIISVVLVYLYLGNSAAQILVIVFRAFILIFRAIAKNPCSTH